MSESDGNVLSYGPQGEVECRSALLEILGTCPIPDAALVPNLETVALKEVLGLDRFALKRFVHDARASYLAVGP